MLNISQFRVTRFLHYGAVNTPNVAKSYPIHYLSLPSVVSSARAFTLARRASKRTSGEHTGEFVFGSSPGAVWVCSAISRKLHNRVSANCEMWDPNCGLWELAAIPKHSRDELA